MDQAERKDTAQHALVYVGIVHPGKTKLNSEERALFGKLRWMGFRVIQEEIELLLKEEEKK
jgi:hypothetical protein